MGAADCGVNLPMIAVRLYCSSCCLGSPTHTAWCAAVAPITCDWLESPVLVIKVFDVTFVIVCTYVINALQRLVIDNIIIHILYISPRSLTST